MSSENKEFQTNKEGKVGEEERKRLEKLKLKEMPLQKNQLENLKDFRFENKNSTQLKNFIDTNNNHSKIENEMLKSPFQQLSSSHFLAKNKPKNLKEENFFLNENEEEDSQEDSFEYFEEEEESQEDEKGEETQNGKQNIFSSPFKENLSAHQKLTPSFQHDPNQNHPNQNSFSVFPIFNQDYQKDLFSPKNNLPPHSPLPSHSPLSSHSTPPSSANTFTNTPLKIPFNHSTIFTDTPLKTPSNSSTKNKQKEKNKNFTSSPNLSNIPTHQNSTFLYPPFFTPFLPSSSTSSFSNNTLTNQNYTSKKLNQKSFLNNEKDEENSFPSSTFYPGNHSFQSSNAPDDRSTNNTFPFNETSQQNLSLLQQNEYINKMRLEYESYIDNLRKTIIENQLKNLNSSYQKEKNNLLQLEQLKTFYLQQIDFYQKNNHSFQNSFQHQNSNLDLSLKFSKLKKKLKKYNKKITFLKEQNKILSQENQNLSDLKNTKLLQQIYQLSQHPQNKNANTSSSFEEINSKNFNRSNNSFNQELNFNPVSHNIKSLDHIKNANQLISQKIEELKKIPTSSQQKLSLTRDLLEMLKNRKNQSQNQNNENQN